MGASVIIWSIWSSEIDMFLIKNYSYLQDVFMVMYWIHVYVLDHSLKENDVPRIPYVDGGFGYQVWTLVT